MFMTYVVHAKDREEKEIVKEFHEFMSDAMFHAKELLACEKIWEVKVDKRVYKTGKCGA